MPSEQPVIHAYSQGIPIWRFGFTWLLDEAPDLIDPAPLQAGNDAPGARCIRKRAGRSATTGWAHDTRMPRTPENDYLPQEAIHLIDGDLQTCWCSRSQPQPDVEPVWIRLDLPVERRSSGWCCASGPRAGSGARSAWSVRTRARSRSGSAMAAELTIKLSRDGWHWETVFEGPTGDAPDRYDFEFSFPARPAKQIWIIGRGFPRVENWLFGFSIAEVEVYDTLDATWRWRRPGPASRSARPSTASAWTPRRTAGCGRCTTTRASSGRASATTTTRSTGIGWRRSKGCSRSTPRPIRRSPSWRRTA